MQYTIRSISEALDDRLKKRAANERSSLNQLVVRLLNEAVGLAGDVPRRDLSDVAGTWKRDAAFDRALVDQDSIEPDLWK